MIPTDPPSGRIVQAIIAYNLELHRMGHWEIYQTQGERDAEPSVRLANGQLRVFQRRPGGAYSFNDKLPEIGSFVSRTRTSFPCTGTTATRERP